MVMLGAGSGDALLALLFEFAGGVHAGTVSVVRHRDSSTRVRLSKGGLQMAGVRLWEVRAGLGCSVGMG